MLFVLGAVPIMIARQRNSIDPDNEWEIKLSPRSSDHTGYQVRIYKNDINVTQKIEPNRAICDYIISDWIPIFDIDRKAAIRLGKKVVRKGIHLDRSPNVSLQEEIIKIDTNRKRNSKHVYNEPIANYLPAEISKLSEQYSKGEIDLEDFELGAQKVLAKERIDAS